MCCASLLETVRKNPARLCWHLAELVFSSAGRRASAEPRAGLNTFLQFLKGPIPGGLAGQFLQALFQSHYALAVGAVQAVGGALLLINRCVPLALTILGPVIVNILLYHLLLNHEGIGGALIVAVFWFVLLFHYRQYFSGNVTAKASSAL